MGLVCTCGAELPPDARFCHKCGRPQGEQPALTEAPPEVERPTGPVAAAPLPLGFHNPTAVRVAIAAAGPAALLSWMLLLGVVFWQFGAGFLSVVFYHRRTGQMLSIRGGARMGWITGVFSFVIFTILLTISMAVIAASRGGLMAVFQEQFRKMPVHDPNMEQALRMLQSPAAVSAMLLTMLVIFFIVITAMCAAGGAIGARIARKD